jgi:hypothetical protein
LVERHADRVHLTPINTGNARRRPAFRGRQTFVPYSSWVESGWASEAEQLGTSRRPSSHQPVEIAAAGGVPDLADMVVAVRRSHGMADSVDAASGVNDYGIS